jgi:hypothetical protein
VKRVSGVVTAKSSVEATSNASDILFFKLFCFTKNTKLNLSKGFLFNQM